MSIVIDKISPQERYNRERQESAQNRKQFVLEKGEELFLKKGLAQVNMSHIMEAADISKATLYRYFNNIDEIIFAIQYDKMRELFYRNDPIDDPLHLVLRMIDRFPEHRRAYRFIGMFDNYYSEIYPNEEMARQYEDFVMKNDKKLGLFMESQPQEMSDRLIVVLNVVISFLQRLALRGKILEKYQGITVEKQLEELKNMIKREFAF